MGDEARQEEIRENSDRLVDLLGEMRDLEEEKRTERMSTPRFHELANEVAGVSREVWKVAEEQRLEGDSLSRDQPVSINDVEPEESEGEPAAGGG